MDDHPNESKKAICAQEWYLSIGRTMERIALATTHNIFSARDYWSYILIREYFTSDLIHYVKMHGR